MQTRNSLTQQSRNLNLNQSLIQPEPIIEEKPVTPPKPSQKMRLNSLDILRGMTMLGMILVDNAGPYPPWFIDHAEWNGLTPADLIFPSFVFIMGMAVPLAMNKNNPVKIRNIIRILALFGIGVFLNLSARKFTFNHFRILGILQRLSLCYGGLVIVHVITNYGQKTKRYFGGIIAILAAMYYLSFMLIFKNYDIECPPSKNLQPFCNYGSYLDRKIFGRYHMIYPNDPQGLFTTLNAFLTGYIGYYYCLIMQDNKGEIYKILKMWVIVSLLLGAIAYPWTTVMPLNKKIWSMSFVFLTAGIAGLSLSFLTLFVDTFGSQHHQYGKVVNIIVQPFIWLGRNPLAVFVLMDALAIVLIKYILINNKSAWSHFYHQVFASWITNHEVASTIFAFFFVILWTTVAGILYRFKIFIRL